MEFLFRRTCKDCDVNSGIFFRCREIDGGDVGEDIVDHDTGPTKKFKVARECINAWYNLMCRYEKAQLMLYIYPVDPNLFDKRRQIRF
ncbi:hypothetical protein ANTRET_LOCUS8785 [Anthophora retusa]